MSNDKQSESSGNRKESETNTTNNTGEALLDTTSPEYVIRYNLYYTGEEVAGVFLPTGHANLTLIERDGTNDKTLGGGNIGVNLGEKDSNGVRAQHDWNSNFSPFDKNLDGIVGIDPNWQHPGQAIYEQSVTPEQLKDVQDHITDLTGGLETGLTNYNVSASVLSLDDQHSCYSFAQDVFEIAGGKGRVIDQFSQSELDKIVDRQGNTQEILIETVHGNIPKIPERAMEKAKDKLREAGDAISDGFESGIENIQEKTGLGSDQASNEVEQDASLIPTQLPFGAETSPEHAGAQAGLTTPFSTFGQVVQQFASDREILRASDPEATQLVTQAANHPEAEAMFLRLNDAGIENFPSHGLLAGTAEERVSNILTQANEIDKTLEAEYDLEQEDLNTQTASVNEEEYDYSLMD